MPVLAAGAARIPYEIRRSLRARRLRVVVTPGRVEVVVPRRVRDHEVAAFVASKREWIAEKTEAMRDRALRVLPERVAAGGEVRFRGRPLPLEASAADVLRPQLRAVAAAAPNGSPQALRLLLPRHWATGEREEAARRAVVGWLSERALADAAVYAERHAAALGRRPRALRITDPKTLWGSCGRNGVVRLNWRLVAAPPAVFEYVVVHELCHLRERNHGPRFWGWVERLLPDYRAARGWLRDNGVGLA